MGLAEGAQQIALARSIAAKTLKLESSVVKYCFTEHLNGEKLAEKLHELIEPLHLDAKSDSLSFVGTITDDIARIEETTGICRAGLTGTTANDLPDALKDLVRHTVAAMYSAFGMKIPLKEDVILSMIESWKLIYRYFWAAFMLLSACFLVVMILIRTTKIDAYDYTTFFVRCFVIVAAGVLLALSATKDLMYAIMATPAILPFSVALLYIIIFSDRLGAWIANRRNIRSGDPLIGADRGHGHGHGHDDRHDDSGEHGAANDKQGLLVSAEPLTSSSPPHHSHHHHHQHSDSTSSAPPVPSIPTHYNPLATWGASNTNLTNPNAIPNQQASIVASPPTYAPARFYDAAPPPPVSPPTFISPSNSPPLPAQPQAQQTYHAREQRQQQRQQQHGRSASQGSEGGAGYHGGYAQGQGQEYVPLQGDGQYTGRGY